MALSQMAISSEVLFQVHTVVKQQGCKSEHLGQSQRPHYSLAVFTTTHHSEIPVESTQSLLKCEFTK